MAISVKAGGGLAKESSGISPEAGAREQRVDRWICCFQVENASEVRERMSNLIKMAIDQMKKRRPAIEDRIRVA
jgi:hypothetical protein